MTFFKNIHNPPPGNLYFYELNGDRVTARTFVEMEPKVRALMLKHGVKGLPEAVLAEYMCPRLPNPGEFCTGPTVKKANVRPREAMDNSVAYCNRRTVTFDVIERRMQTCAKCPKHARDWCPTCTGHASRIREMFGSRRPSLPIDASSGVCQCAKAYEMAVASVEYGENDKVWDGTPDTCWRKTDV